MPKVIKSDILISDIETNVILYLLNFQEFNLYIIHVIHV